MDAFLHQFQHLKIQLEEITSATDNFNDENNLIGVGGFGKVYKGEVSHSKGRSMAAIKRLDPKHGQGIPEFLKEITTLSRYSHENLISLLGFCYQGNEMILVYEHASRSSLDRHLSSPHLTWSQRLQICLDAAKGLSHLHDPRRTHQRLIHCDIKSSNILLDDNWKAKVSDFGLSIMGPANEQYSVIVTSAAGTPGYCDPQFAMTHTLTKESDVYSFGVVLFEVLCGRLCCTYRDGHVEKKFVPMWTESYEHKKLNDIIFKSQTIEPLDPSSLETVSNIAYRCLKESREDRPKMAEVVKHLESACNRHQFTEVKLSPFHQMITQVAEPPLYFKSEAELKQLIHKGVLLNGGKTWFSINKKGEHHEMISVAECLDNSRLNLVKPRYGSDTYYSKDRSPMGVYIYNGFDTYYSIDRFAVGVYIYNYHEKLKTHVKSQLLSPLTTYVVNFLFSFDFPKWECEPIILAYRLQGETKTSVSYLAYEIEDGIWACELFQFTSDSQIVDLEIMFEGFNECYELICVQGIEFRPMEKEEHKDENQSISDSDAYWEEKLPADYEDIMKWSTDILQWTTKKEAYSIIRKGFLIDDGEKWFFLHKNGKKCHKLSAAYIRTLSKDDEIHLSETRFKEATLLSSSGFSIKCKIESHLLSPQTTYATYLVYKYLPENQLRFEGPVGVIFGSFDNRWHVYLVSPTTPVIRPKADQNTHNPVHRPKIKGIPQQRNDGWMEVQIWEFRTAATIEMVPIDFYLDSGNHIPWEVRPGFPYKMVHSDLFSVNHNIPSFDGLVIQGFEVRPT